ncbi:uncharacterized protein LOC103722126 [Phoenix dactylifera]|uniref:Uncharacterized protein LOC103722126 n=1 Tax=Phoenix dactylifera TaxID=42345 RepID=A0A8B7D0Q7_PHODC|nr:uncharacterized protein LOC103722126 [Phoenix dactylifera]
MEFRFRAGEERHPSFLPPTPCSFSSSSSAAAGYFAEQAWRADFGGIRRDVVQPMTAVESLQRLIQKERIREEIMREMAQRRVLEEEVRREMEIERLMVMRRVHPERFCDPMVGRFVPEVRLGDEIERGLGARVPVVEFDKRFLLDVRPKIRGEKKLPLSPQQLELRSIESSTHVEVKPSEQKLSGTKRKAVANAGAGKLPKPQKDWSCALCQVTATSEERLNDHLEGKKHKANLLKLEVSKTGLKNNGATAFKPKTAVATKEDASTDGPKTLKMQVDGKMHEVLQNKKFLLCKCCKVRCNSTLAMASHLSGKRHNSWMGVSKNNHKEKDLTTEAAKKDDVEKEGKDAVEGAVENDVEKEEKVAAMEGAMETVMWRTKRCCE